MKAFAFFLETTEVMKNILKPQNLAKNCGCIYKIRPNFVVWIMLFGFIE